MNLAMILMESMATKLKDAGINTLICICVVFAVLIFISLVISLFSFIPKAEASAARRKARKKEEKELAAKAVDNAVSQIETKETEVSEVIEEPENLTDDLELVAVIAAAIAASQNAVSTDGFVVRSIRKVRR